jgi:hypothetical protein
MTTAWAHDNGGDALSPESAMLHPGSPESPSLLVPQTETEIVIAVRNSQ